MLADKSNKRHREEEDHSKTDLDKKSKKDYHPGVTFLTGPHTKSGATAKLLADHDTFLIDCDGVLWNGSVVRPGAQQVISHLRELGKKVFFITNNSTKSRFSYVKKMESLGFANLSPDMMYCSSSLAALYLKRKYPSIKKAYVVGEHGIEEELNHIGVKTLGGTTAPIPLNYITEDEFQKIELDPDVGAVVCGWDRRFSFLKLSTASMYVHNSHQREGGCIFIATNRDSADKVTDTRFIPGGGCMVSAIEASSVVPERSKPSAQASPTLGLWRCWRKNTTLTEREQSSSVIAWTQISC